MDLVVFWIVAPVSIGAAAAMLFQRNTVYAALLLILNQFTLAVMFALLGAHFLAAVQVIVYAGAIMVLFLFVIMFLGVDRREALVEHLRGQRFLAIALGVLLVGAVIAAVALGVEGGPGPEPRGDDVTVVGRTLFTRFVFPFEVTSILLIIAAVAAMVLARRTARGLPDEEDQAAAPPGEPAEPERVP